MFNWLRSKKTKHELNQIKKKLVGAIDQNILDSQTSIDDFVKIFTDFKTYNYTKHDAFLNLCIFSDIFNIDITILVEKIRMAERLQEKKLYARVIAVVIVDYLDNISVLIGSNCLKELKANNMNEFIDEFKTIHKKFSDFKRANDRLLREIRNNTIAHKSKDALKLNEQINNLDVEKIYNFGLDLKIYSKDFIDLSTKIINYIADYMREGRRI